MHRLLASRATLWGCDGSAGGVKADWTSVERRPTSQRASTGPRSSHGSVDSGLVRGVTENPPPRERDNARTDRCHACRTTGPFDQAAPRPATLISQVGL